MNESTLWMRQVREMCSGGNRDGVQGGLGHWLLWTSWRTLRGHQHHCGVGGWRVVRLDDTGLHMGLGCREREKDKEGRERGAQSMGNTLLTSEKLLNYS